MISKLTVSDATWTYPRMPWEVVQMVLVPDTPGVWKSTQRMAKPFTVMVDDVTLSPARPAASEKSCRKVTQCEGV